MPPLVIQIFSPFKVQVPFVILDRLGANRGGIGAGSGFRQAKRGDQFAAGQLRQVARFLLGSAEQQNALHADGTVRADGEGHRAVVRAALTQYARIAGVRQAESAVLLRNDETEQAQIAQALDEFRRLLRVAVPALEVLMFGAKN